MNKILSTNILIFLLSIVACSSKKNVSESNEKNKNVNGIEKSTVNNSDENITPKNNDTPLSPTKPTNGIQMPTGIYITSSAIDAGFSPSVVSNEDIEGIYLRLSWNSIEPEDDKYNWSFIDQQIAQAIQYNKKVVIGIVSGKVYSRMGVWCRSTKITIQRN
ncbi:MAG: beta-galactosidase [Bacteroidetes bacterium]|nr:beta-galactosidase [Bacteroidota bacterium]